MNKDVVARSQICHFEQINLQCSLLSVSFAAESSQQREKQFYGISMKYSRASRAGRREKKSWRSFEVSQDDGVGSEERLNFSKDCCLGILLHLPLLRSIESLLSCSDSEELLKNSTTKSSYSHVTTSEMKSFFRPSCQEWLVEEQPKMFGDKINN